MLAFENTFNRTLFRIVNNGFIVVYDMLIKFLYLNNLDKIS